jgi:DnaJ-domain-containing protein 1
MESQVIEVPEWGSSFGSTMQDRRGATPEFEQNGPGQAWQFAAQIAQLLGNDSEPDPLFFEESWALGVPAAVENWRQRLARRSACGAPYEFHHLGSEMFMRQREWYPQSASESAAQIATSAAVPEDVRGTLQSAIKPAGRESAAKRESQAWEEFETFADGGGQTGCPMTLPRACELLGVTASANLAQIRAAYLRMVSRWHPDRLERGSEEARQHATDQMATINDAWHLLRSGLQQESA